MRKLVSPLVRSNLGIAGPAEYEDLLILACLLADRRPAAVLNVPQLCPDSALFRPTSEARRRLAS
jgi:hypothetical protein